MSEGSREIVGAVSHMKKSGTLRPVIIGSVIGVVLLLIGSFAFSYPKDSKTAGEQESKSPLVGFWEYKDRTEREIESLCVSVYGVRSAHAVVFFDGVGGSIYAQNTQQGSTTKNEYVIVGSGSNSHALYIGESLPKISGIGVVCDTGGNTAKLNEVASLISAAYGLPLTRVYVASGE